MMQSYRQNTTPTSIDTSLPVEERIHHFLQCSANPYYIQIGDINVDICYRQGGATLQQKVIDLCNQSLEM